MKKQTAVDFLMQKIREGKHLKKVDYEQAKQMEREQMFEYIKDLYVLGDASYEFHKKQFDKYYNQNYGDDKKTD